MNFNKFRRKFLVNVNRTSHYDIYIGRPSKWGNPHTMNEIVTRRRAIEKHKLDLQKNEKIKDEVIKELTGKILGCHCFPLPCHGDNYLEILYNEYIKNKINNKNQIDKIIEKSKDHSEDYNPSINEPCFNCPDLWK